ncbi:MAG: sigma-70 family RNA polymerase sigma factor [Rhodocyclaceae bacterium]
MSSRRVVDVRLDPEYEASLWHDFARGGESARAALIDAYLPFARILCAKLYGARTHDEFEFDDYFQYASIGLLEAIERFDPARGALFRTYAAHRIQGAILNGLERLSERQQQVAARRALLAERMEHARDELAEVKDGHDALRSLAEIGIGLALGFMLEGSSMYDAGDAGQGVFEHGYSRLEMRQMRERTAGLVKQLPSRECELITLHYLQGVPFEEIARQWALSKGRVSQLHHQALGRLRKLVNADRLCDLNF